MRVLCAAVSGPGHVYPMLACARGLAHAGHDVIAALDARFERHATAEGLSFTPLPRVTSPDESNLNLYELARGMGEVMAREVPKFGVEVAFIEVLALGVAFACDVHGIPWGSLVVHPLHLPSRDLPPFGAGYPPPRTALGRRKHERARQRQRIDLDRATADCNAARTALGLQPVTNDPQMSREFIAVGTLPSLEPPRSDWPSRAHVVGPLLWEPPFAPEAPIPDGDEPLVLIAASTAHTGTVAQAAVDACERLGVRAVVTTGAGPSPRVHSSRIAVVDEAPHDPLVRAASVVVCNGGHGILSRALAHGVPAVIAPQHGDQKENAARASRIGAAVVATSPRAVARAIRRALHDDRIGMAARRTAAEAAALDGPATVASLVAGLAGKQREAG